MKKTFYAFPAIIAGLIASQVLGTIQVYFSNQHLYQRLLLIVESGYLAIPNQSVMPLLLDVKTALFGGLFFTFSIGLGLCLVTFVLVWIGDRIFSRSRLFLLPVLLLLVGVLASININGFNPWGTSYFIVVPAIVAVMLIPNMVSISRQQIWSSIGIYFFPIIALSSIWLYMTDDEVFVKLRDTTLLSNKIGISINDFYYSYTMYPAEAFKTLQQKSIKTSSLATIEDREIADSLSNVLIKHDYLPIEHDLPVDLKIVPNKDMLQLVNMGTTILQIPYKEFLASPEKVLEEFSNQADTHLFFRPFVFWAIVLCLPIIMYGSVFGFFNLFFRLFLTGKSAAMAGLILTVSLALVSLYYFSYSSAEEIHTESVSEAIQSDQLYRRIEALKYLHSYGMDPGNYANFQEMLKSPRIQERYWLARALGNSRMPETFANLVTLLDDEHPNVVCMAFYALGQRGDEKAIDDILNHVKTSDHWYEQWYGYRALKTLGWVQSRRGE